MNVVCTSDICPIALNAKCVFYESSALPNIGIATNDSLQVALQKIELAIAAAGEGTITSVNGDTGPAVVLTAGEIGAAAPGDNISIFVNDSGYLTAATAGALYAPISGSANYWKTAGTTTLTGASVDILSPAGTIINFGDGLDNPSQFNVDVTTSGAFTAGGRGILYNSTYTARLTDATQAADDPLTIVSKGYADAGFWKTAGTTNLTSSVSIDGAEDVAIDFNLVNASFGNTLLFQLTPNFVYGNVTGPGGTDFGEFTINNDGIDLEATDPSGNILVSINHTNGFRINSTVATFPGATYQADYSANYTNRSLVDKEYVDLAVAGVGGITNTAANTELMMSDGTNAVGSNVYMNGDSEIDLGNASLAGSDRWIVATGSAAAVNLNIQAKNNIASALTLIAGQTGKVTATSHSFAATTVVIPFKVRTRSTTGVTAGIGTGIAFESATQDNNANYEIGATIEAVTTNVTAGNEAFDLVFKTMTAGAAAAEKLRISGSQITISTATLRTIGPGNTSATDSLVVMDSDSHVIASFSNDENLNIGSGGTYASGPAGVVFISNVDTAPVATPTSGVFIYAQDSGDANATLAIYTEQAVETIGTFTPSDKLKIRINGVEYWIQLDAV